MVKGWVSKEAAIVDVFKLSEVKEVLASFDDFHYGQDVSQEVCIILLQKPDKEIKTIYKRGHLKRYTMMCLLNIYYWEKAKLSYTFRRHNSKEIPSGLQFEYGVIDDDNKDQIMLEELCIKELQKIYWYHRGLIELYVEFGNYRAVAEKTKIPLSKVYSDIQKGRTMIKDRIASQI